MWPSEPVPASDLLGWHGELGRLMSEDVQIVLVTPELDPVLAMQIAREGRVLYQGPAGGWLEARVRLWQSYQDALPFLTAARRELEAFVDEVRHGS